MKLFTKRDYNFLLEAIDMWACDHIHENPNKDGAEKEEQLEYIEKLQSKIFHRLNKMESKKK